MYDDSGAIELKTAKRILRQPFMTYGLRLWFHLHEANPINSDTDQIEFSLGERKIKLKSEFGNSIKGSNALILLSGGFDSQENAVEYGTRLQNSLSLCGPLLRRGIDVGSEKTIIGAGRTIKKSSEDEGAQFLEAVHGLLVYREDIETKFITGHPPTVTISFHSEDFFSALDTAYQLDPIYTPKEEIAFKLYNSSFFENTPTAKFLSLINVLEVLSNRSDEDESVKIILRDLISFVKSSHLGDAKKEQIINRLSGLMKESVSSSIRSLIRSYLGEAEARFCTEAYNVRSRLLHDGTLIYRENEFGQKICQLDEIVAHLMIRISESKCA